MVVPYVAEEKGRFCSETRLLPLDGLPDVVATVILCELLLAEVQVEEIGLVGH